MITLNLSVEKINTILAALGKVEYVVAQPLIDEIKGQAIPQLNNDENKETN